MHLAFPFRISSQGRVENAERQDYVEALIEVVLFTRPGDRVNRPQFGCAVQDLIFEPANADLAATVSATIAAQLSFWLRDVIDVQSVDASAEDATLTVVVKYRMLDALELNSATFVRGVAS